MLRKRFVIHRPDKKRKRRRIYLMVSNFLLLLGSLVLVLSLIYILFNLEKSDTLIDLLIPLVITGIGLIVASQLIYPFQFKLRK